ncbi:MAG TPA: hypothetical protein VJ372_10605 [Pyrinomonadaceae bacterium]|nr:hypothetical protein [Pyrinomonadaceae bacterium]
MIITLIGVAPEDSSLSTIGMINTALGALIGLPLLIVGKTRVSQAAHLLSGEPSMRTIESRREIQSLNAGLEPETNRLIHPESVNEHTTLDLKGHRKV